MLFFGPKRPQISTEDEEWQLETWRWLNSFLYPVKGEEHPGLVLPSRKLFPETSAKGHERAQHYFEITRELMGMGEWPCTLEAHEPSRELGRSIGGSRPRR